MIAFDFETHLIERLRPAPRPVCLSWHDGERSGLLVGNDMRDWLASRLAEGAHLVGQNVSYDMRVAMARWPELAPEIFRAYAEDRVTDTQIRQQLFFIGTRPSFDDSVPYYSLARLVQLIFDEDISAGKGPDTWRMRYAELDGVPLSRWPKEAIDYPISDAVWTWRAWDAQERQAKCEIRDDAFQSYAAFSLDLAASRGMRTSAAAVDACEAQHLATLDELRPQLLGAGLLAYEGPKKDPQRKLIMKRAPAQAMVRQAWIDLHRRQAAAGEELSPVIYTPAAQKRHRAAELRNPDPCDLPASDFSTDKAAALATGHETLRLRARYVLAEKILSTYVGPMRAGTEGPITTRFGLASTTRTTSGAPGKPLVGTNLQNAPRSGGVRECIVPRAGHLLLTADLAAAELHTLAEACRRIVGHTVMGDLLKDHKDLHLYLGCLLIGIKFDADAEARYAQGDPELKRARQQAKPANFGFGGAMGWRTFVLYNLKQGTVFTPSQARRLRATWLDAYPEMSEYFDACKRELGPSNSAVIELWPGGPWRRVKGLSMIANSRFQAPAARGAKLGVTAVTRAAHRGELDAVRPVNFVHDELVAELEDRGPDENAKNALAFGQILEHSFNIMCPNYPTTVDAVLADRYAKGAEPVYDAKGRLTVWSPECA